MLWITLALAGEWSRLPIDPHYETDFTAYTVRPGLVRVGINSLDVGVLPELSIGTRPLYLALGAVNVNAKINGITAGWFDASLEAGILYRAITIQGVGIAVTSYPITFQVSEQVSNRFSLHQGLHVENFEVTGNFGIDGIATLAEPLIGQDLSETFSEELMDAGSLYGGAHLTLLQAKLAADFRINHRDSLIYQYKGWFWLGARVDAGYAGEGELATAGVSAKVRTPLSQQLIGTHTISWQLTWPHWRLRLGIGYGAGTLGNPLSTITQACELYYLIGKTRPDTPPPVN
jgi:hypothetical protein